MNRINVDAEVRVILNQVHFVMDDQTLQPFGQLRDDAQIFRRHARTGIDQKQQYVCTLNLAPGPCNAVAFHLVLRIAQAGRIDDIDR